MAVKADQQSVGKYVFPQCHGQPFKTLVIVGLCQFIGPVAPLFSRYQGSRATLLRYTAPEVSWYFIEISVEIGGNQEESRTFQGSVLTLCSTLSTRQPGSILPEVFSLCARSATCPYNVPLSCAWSTVFPTIIMGRSAAARTCGAKSNSRSYRTNFAIRELSISSMGEDDGNAGETIKLTAEDKRSTRICEINRISGSSCFTCDFNCFIFRLLTGRWKQ